jgi:polyribonucleotide nucleotidyltransferase
MSSATVHTAEIAQGGRTIYLETGRLAKQASGAVLVRLGDTVVLVTAVVSKNERNVDFFPLTVDVEEGMYAAGKIPGGFIKKEGRPSDRAILNARMIDRPIRPLWPKGFNKETHIVATVLSVDRTNPYDMLAIIGASAALSISEAPFQGPIGAVRMGKVDGEWVLNPTFEELEMSTVALTVAGTADAISMVEAGCDQVSEDEVLEGMKIAHEAIKEQVGVIEDLAARVGIPQMAVAERKPDPALVELLRSRYGERMVGAVSVFDKLERQDAVASLKQSVLSDLASEVAEYNPDDPMAGTVALAHAFDAVEKETVRQRIAVQKVRPDGRRADEIRALSCEVGVAPRPHGSGLFTRGQTQVMTLLTLGTGRDEQRIDDLGIQESKQFMHHYKFPPFCVGETGFMRGPSRRDIGHGALGERAMLPVIPHQDDFPYTIRLVSEVLESNGSSSMASVCASMLALMDAGVPVKRPVAGIAMGLIKEGDDYIVLTDIAGVEDHLGDMDFKVAGSRDGITALQMDIKIKGVSFDILADALEQARVARLAILEAMADTISEPRSDLSPYAPRIMLVKIDPDKIGAIIGKGGETIRGLEAEYECSIDVDEEGLVRVYAADGHLGEGCVAQIKALTKDIVPGEVIVGRVSSTTNFGAFVTLKPGQDGLVHISKLASHRVATVEEVVQRGDLVKVEVLEVAMQGGKEKISLKLLEKMGDDPAV